MKLQLPLKEAGNANFNGISLGEGPETDTSIVKTKLKRPSLTNLIPYGAPPPWKNLWTDHVFLNDVEFAAVEPFATGH